jgi:alpha-L-fucosidase
MLMAAGPGKASNETGGGPLSATPTVRPGHQFAEGARYVPGAENLAARRWFQDAKFGVFVHWGVYSVPARGEWVMHSEKMSNAEYEKLPPQFNPTRFNAAEWVALFKQSGAKYVTITAKHADGFAMWDSKVSDWDIVDRTPYGRDVIKLLADECHRQGLKLFLYYSQLDWHHADYYPRGTTGQYSGRANHGEWNKYLDYMDAQLTELVGGEYGPIAGIWFDGWWDQQTKRMVGYENARPQLTNVDWRLRRSYDLIHSFQPACLIGANHHIAPFEGEDFQMFERDLPGENKAGHSPDAEIGNLPLETCDTINSSWGYNASDQDYKSVATLVRQLVKAAGRNANYLLNVGPLPDGTIDPHMARRLEDVGKWLSRYGHTIRGTRGGPTGIQPWGTSLQTADVVYLHILDRSMADSDGWLTLTGTDSLVPKVVQDSLTGAEIVTRRDAGRLQLRVDKKVKSIDWVLTAAKSNRR